MFLYYQNVRGLRTKTKNFFVATCDCDYDIVVLTETWLLPSIYDSELFSDDFVVHRCDRSNLNSLFSLGGGVLIAVRTLLSSARIILPNTEKLEIVAVKISLVSCNVYICCVYIPPGSSEDTYNLYSEALLTFLNCIDRDNNDIVLILGDFNCSLIQWDYDPDNNLVLLPTKFNSIAESYLVYNLISADLYQLNIP